MISEEKNHRTAFVACQPDFIGLACGHGPTKFHIFQPMLVEALFATVPEVFD